MANKKKISKIDLLCNYLSRKPKCFNQPQLISSKDLHAHFKVPYSRTGGTWLSVYLSALIRGEVLEFVGVVGTMSYYKFSDDALAMIKANKLIIKLWVNHGQNWRDHLHTLTVKQKRNIL